MGAMPLWLVFDLLIEVVIKALAKVSSLEFFPGILDSQHQDLCLCIYATTPKESSGSNANAVLFKFKPQLLHFVASPFA